MPSMTFEDQAACALIHNDLGHSTLAKEHAERALQASHREQSDFRNHPSLGVVEADVLSGHPYRKLEEIAAQNR